MTATETDTNILDALDFEHVQPCEHSEHGRKHADESAMFLVRRSCPKCHTSRDYFLCLSGWESMAKGVRHIACGRPPRPREEIIRILRVIGGPR